MNTTTYNITWWDADTFKRRSVFMV